uniref:Uncharacterized protein n=1 Tax=Glossina palpalis gambiensis TaxID=67801 RepID=A0A1B0BIC6_9MUSC
MVALTTTDKTEAELSSGLAQLHYVGGGDIRTMKELDREFYVRKQLLLICQRIADFMASDNILISISTGICTVYNPTVNNVPMRNNRIRLSQESLSPCMERSIIET